MKNMGSKKKAKPAMQQKGGGPGSGKWVPKCPELRIPSYKGHKDASHTTNFHSRVTTTTRGIPIIQVCPEAWFACPYCGSLCRSPRALDDHQKKNCEFKDKWKKAAELVENINSREKGTESHQYLAAKGKGQA